MSGPACPCRHVPCGVRQAAWPTWVGRFMYGGAPLTVHLARLCGTHHGHADALLPYSLEHEDESWWYSEYILNLAAAALYGPHHVLQVSRCKHDAGRAGRAAPVARAVHTICICYGQHAQMVWIACRRWFRADRQGLCEMACGRCGRCRRRPDSAHRLAALCVLGSGLSALASAVGPGL